MGDSPGGWFPVAGSGYLFPGLGEKHAVGLRLSPQIGWYGDFVFPYVDRWTPGGREKLSGIHPDRYGQDRWQRLQDSYVEHRVFSKRDLKVPVF
jgi:hypothetical protein